MCIAIGIYLDYVIFGTKSMKNNCHMECIGNIMKR